MTKGKWVEIVTPVQAKDGKLLTEETDIRDRIFEYYKELKQDDPDNISGDKEFWSGKCQKRAPEELPGKMRNLPGKKYCWLLEKWP